MKAILVFLYFLLLGNQHAAAIEVEHVSYGKFGNITIYHPSGSPVSVVLFISGDGGWKDVVISMAAHMAASGAMVLGIDARHYEYYLSKQSSGCLYPAADFEELSLSIQKKYRLPNYLKPVLTGYSYGATLIYAVLAQAPANTFKGAIAIGFSPDLNVNKPLCKGNGLGLYPVKKGFSYMLQSTKTLTAPFVVINGRKDLACPYARTEAFLKGMPMTELIALPNAGHGFKNREDWEPELRNAFKKILITPGFTERKSAENNNLKNQTIIPFKGELPLTVIPSAQQNKLPIVFMISGDGGWTSFDQSLAEELASKGLSVIGLDAQKYFWNAKSPDQTSAEVSLALRHYLTAMGKENLILAGYSFGASIVPFIANRLSVDLKPKLKAVISLSPDVTADFEIHLLDLFNFGNSKDKYNVLSEIKKISPVIPISIFGTEEGNKIKMQFQNRGIKVLTISGDHHFDKDYEKISTVFLKQIPE